MSYPNRINVRGDPIFNTRLYYVNRLGDMAEEAHRKYTNIGQTNGLYNVVCVRAGKRGRGAWVWQAPCLVNWDHIMDLVEANDLRCVQQGLIDANEIPYCRYMICNYYFE